MLGLGRARRTTASVASLSAVTTALAVLVLIDPGYRSPDVELNDSGVWVTRSSALQLGRFNYEAQSVDAAVVAGSADLDVLQQDDLVLLTDEDAGTVSVVDPAIVEPGGAVALGEGNTIALGGTTAAVWEADGGAVWAMPASELSAFDPESDDPVAQIDRGGDVAVGLDGVVYVADPGTATLTTLTVDTDGSAEGAAVRDLDLSGGAGVDLTVVGSVPVVLDRDTDRLLLGGRSSEVPDGQVVLQEPGPAADTVALGTADGLVLQPLDGGEPTLTPAEGEPVPPVHVGGCTYGAWSSGDVARDCGSEVFTANLPTSGSVRYRVNRGYVVLNDLATGTVWLADQDFEQLDGWDDLESDTEANDEETDDVATEIDDILRERDLPNRPPVAVDDSFGVRPGRTTILAVIDNDTDPDTTDTLTVSASDTASAEDAVVDVDADGSFTYDPDGQFETLGVGDTDTDTFDYTVSDGTGGTDTATVTVTVDNANPDANADTASTPTDTPVNVDVLANDTDANIPGTSQVLSIISASADNGAVVVVEGDGTLTVTPDAGFDGVVTVTYTVSDGAGGTAGGTLTVTVDNAAPTAVDDSASTAYGTPVDVNLLSNDTDANADTLSVSSTTPPRDAHGDERGTVTVTDGVATYTPPSQFSGEVTFSYTVSDGHGGTDTATVTVVVANAPPQASADTAKTPEGRSVVIAVTENDTDQNGEVLSLVSVTQPRIGGSVAIVDGQVVFTPDPGFSGTASFTYTVMDASGELSTAAVTVDVQAAVSGTLAQTGFDAGSIALLAFALVFSGGFLALIARRAR